MGGQKTRNVRLPIQVIGHLPKQVGRSCHLEDGQIAISQALDLNFLILSSSDYKLERYRFRLRPKREYVGSLRYFGTEEQPRCNPECLSVAME